MNNNIIFYGAGRNMEALLDFFDACGIPFDYPIWDRNADNIKSIKGHKVQLPKYEKADGVKAIITISDDFNRDEVANKLSQNGFEVLTGLEVRKKANVFFPTDFTDFDKEIIKRIVAENLTMVEERHLYNIVIACKYVMDNNIEGDWVECGVWRGGASLLAAAIFKHYGAKRKVYLYDTFGWFNNVKGSEEDIDADKISLSSNSNDMNYEQFCSNETIEDVKANFKRHGLLDENVIFIKGDVMKTLADEQNLPKKVAIFRNDTDYYNSTKMQMQVFYPRLSVNGVYINDDYDWCIGSKIATDEYFEATKTPKPFLQFVGVGRIGIKTAMN